jgi:hypothetical protein
VGAVVRHDARYRATRLLRDVGRDSVYVTMDSGESREAYEESKRRYAVEYAGIDSKCKGMTVRERLIF